MTAPAIALLDQPRSDGSPRIKFCGFTEPEGIRAAIAAGADALGLNFWPGSKRHVSPEVAAAWFEGGKPSVTSVGVFVNPAREEVLSIWLSGLIDVAQLHGDESPEFTRSLLAEGVPVIRAFGFAGEESFERALEYGTPYLLADAPAPGTYGGTGRVIDWEKLAETKRKYPEVRLVLSGGLNPSNAGAANAAVHPVMLDSASGVESSPGIKDPGLCREFVSAVRNAIRRG
ncbi:MAG: phosphoribosylanthranilate isomerase [Verrucomicrobiales bacterium]